MQDSHGIPGTASVDSNYDGMHVCTSLAKYSDPNTSTMQILYIQVNEIRVDSSCNANRQCRLYKDSATPAAASRPTDDDDDKTAAFVMSQTISWG